VTEDLAQQGLPRSSQIDEVDRTTDRLGHGGHDLADRRGRQGFAGEHRQIDVAPGVGLASREGAEEDGDPQIRPGPRGWALRDPSCAPRLGSFRRASHPGTDPVC